MMKKSRSMSRSRSNGSYQKIENVFQTRLTKPLPIHRKGSTFSITILSFIYLTVFTPSSSNGETLFMGNCTWESRTRTLFCSHFFCSTNSTNPGPRFMDSIIQNLGSQIVSEVRQIQINESFIPTVNLEQFHSFESLTHLIITNSSVCLLKGVVPKSLKSLNLSINVLMNHDFDGNIFANSSIEELDFSHNKLEQLPNGTFGLPLRRLSLIGNEIQCNWVTGTKFYEWAYKNHGVIQSIDDTFCIPEEAAFTKITILSALKVRETGLEECHKTDCECGLFSTIVVGAGNSPFKNFPIVHSNKYGNVSLTLKFDCSNLGLTELPSISPYTVILAADNNMIRDLSRLNEDTNYAHLDRISLNHNQIEIENFESIINTPFFDRVQVFKLKSNSISRISERTINSIFASNNNARRINNIAIGDNVIYCDCNSFTKLRSSFITHKVVIQDWETVRCRSPNITFAELKFEDVCYIETKETDWPWWIVVGIEGVIIIAVLAKLWRDRREYRRTGQLPMLSTCIPRLPCDFMLEGIKESHHYHHTEKS